MRYCTLSDLRLSMSDQTLIWLSNDDVSATSINESVLTEAVRSAEELVDAHLRGRYTLPLETAPTVLKDVTVNLARHWLYSRRPEGADLPDVVTQTYKASLTVLHNITNGKLSIGVPSGAALPEPGEIKVRSRPQRFAINLLDRY